MFVICAVGLESGRSEFALEAALGATCGFSAFCPNICGGFFSSFRLQYARSSIKISITSWPSFSHDDLSLIVNRMSCPGAGELLVHLQRSTTINPCRLGAPSGWGRARAYRVTKLAHTDTDTHAHKLRHRFHPCDLCVYQYPINIETFLL